MPKVKCTDCGREFSGQSTLAVHRVHRHGSVADKAEKQASAKPAKADSKPPAEDDADDDEWAESF